MKIPKYILEALERRARAAITFNKYDYKIYKFLEENNIQDDVEDYDILGGCESVVNPVDSIERIAAAIIAKGKPNGK